MCVFVCFAHIGVLASFVWDERVNYYCKPCLGLAQQFCLALANAAIICVGTARVSVEIKKNFGKTSWAVFPRKKMENGIVCICKPIETIQFKVNNYSVTGFLFCFFFNFFKNYAATLFGLHLVFFGTLF